MMAETLTQPTTAPTPNGHGPRMERHYAWFDVPEYSTFQVKGWTNPKQATLLDLDSADRERVAAAIHALIVDTRTIVDEQTYQGWFDCDGDPLPAANTDEFFDVVPTELLRMALRVVRREGPTALGNESSRTRKPPR